MAWQRDEANLGISGATAYSYTEVDWEVHGDRCTYRHIGGVTSPYNFSATATSTLQWWENGTWHDYAGPASATFNGYGDLPLVDVEDYFVRQAADRVVSLGTYTTMMGGSARSYIDYTVPHAAPAVTWAASNPVVRNSDNSITLTWNAPSLEYSAMCLEVSTDGGSWSQFAVLWNTATSYEWTGCSADHSYQFRIRTNYLASYSAYDTCATVIYMTPAAPQSISTAAAGGTNITVNLVNPSPVATKVQYEVSTDDGETWGATQDSASLTSFAVSASGTVKIRVRNYNATGTSAWLTSDTVTTICPPAKPTITSPQTGAWDVSQPLDVSWLHNSLDGSAQEAYKLRVTKLTPPLDSHTETYSPSTASTQSITWAQIQSWLPTLALGGKLGIGIATKGADASYSDYGTAASITPFTAPSLSITKPTATVTGMPIEFEATYSDMAGYTCQAATVSLQKDGRTLFSEPCEINGTAITAQLDTSEFLPANGETYTVVLTARSSSSLQATANATFTTSFTEPQAAELSITDDPDTGYASLLATFDNHATDTEYSGNTNTQHDSEPSYVKSLTVEGQSKKWNQLVHESTRTWTNNGVTFSITPTSVTANNTSTGTAYANCTVTSSGLKGHKIFLGGCPSGGGNATYFIKDGYESTPRDFGDGVIYTKNTNNCVAQIIISQGYAASNLVFHPHLIDLTAIFGSGNEPASVDAFKATDVYNAKLAAGELYTYDAGSLVSISSVAVGDGTIAAMLRSAGSVHDQLQADAHSWTVERKIGTRAYQAGDESDTDVLTDGTTTYYALTTPTTDTPTSMSTIEIGSAFTVETELDSTFDMTTWDGSADAVSISVARVNADGITPLIEDGESGAGAVDKYAPLNTPYQYAVTTKSSANAVKTVYVDNEIVTDLWFAYWGDNIASAKWNPDNGGIAIARPQKTRVYYAGRKDPVSYDGAAVSLTETPSWMIVDRSEVQPFVQLIEDGGRGVYKSCDGWVYHADFELTLTPKYTAIGYYGGVGLSVTRIAGDAL